MKTIVVGSVTKNAGKTSLVVGLAKGLQKKIGYMKPFGDRLLYKKKRLWDYDSALIASVFDLKENPEDMSIGFEHAKLRYVYDEKTTGEKLSGEAARNGSGKDILFVEGPETLSSGISIHLDTMSIAKTLGGKLIFVLSGNDDDVVDDALFVKKYVDITGVDFGGVIVNKAKDIEDFNNTYLGYIKDMGIPVLGVIPNREELGRFTVSHIANSIFAKVLAGEKGLDRQVARVFIGAMSADIVLKGHDFKSVEKKLVITSGDRSDMLLAALETDTSGIVISNNILPPSNIISKAEELNIPLLMVSADTFQVAKQIDDMEPLITRDAPEKIDILEELAKTYVDLKSLK